MADEKQGPRISAPPNTEILGAPREQRPEDPVVCVCHNTNTAVERAGSDLLANVS